MSNAAVLERKKPTLKRASDLKKEFDSRSITPDQTKPINLGSNLEDPFVRPDPDIFVPENDVLPADLDKLAFNEEPVKILIHRSGEKFSPKTTDLVAVNGIKAEMLFRNGWVQMGFLPRGVPLYTKRKYVEQLAHSKTTSYATRHEGTEVERPQNWTDPNTTPSVLFSVLEDKNPLGVEWLSEILRNQS
jgi:hypothetical protein